MHVYERYVGLRGQLRIGLVDKHGRVHHYDVEEWERLMTEHDPTAMEPDEQPPLQGGDVSGDEQEPQDLPDKPDISDDEMPGDEGDDPPTDDEEAEDEADLEVLDEEGKKDDDTVDNTEQPEEPVVFEPSEDDYEEVPED